MKSRIINLLTHISIVMAELDFAVHIEGGDEAANILADKHEMINMGEIIPESGYYLLRTHENSRRRRSLRNMTDLFLTDPEVDWSEYQSPKIS